MNKITEELKELVRQEADNLIKHAKESELLKLDFKHLSSLDSNFCIYGQMTGSCFSDRANELLAKCTKPFAVSLVGPYECEELNEVDPLDFERAALLETLSRTSFSPIEYYIAQDGAKNDNLIAYLRGEVKTLEL